MSASCRAPRLIATLAGLLLITSLSAMPGMNEASAAERELRSFSPWSSQSVPPSALLDPDPSPQPGPPQPPVAAAPEVVPDTPTAFSLAVIPDTQRELHEASDTRFDERMEWLVAKRSALDLRYVVHTGDVVDWDDPTHAMYERASAGFARLDDAGIAWSAAVGNHDTAAVCSGGSACPGGDASVDVRDTTTWNEYFPADRLARLGGTFEDGRSDNNWTTFDAGGRHWLVLTLELWPRPEVVDWADDIVATHPDHNVIVNTHMFLAQDGSISQTAGGYGATSPQYLYDRVIARRPNVKIVLSGHVGTFAHRVETIAGNKVVMLSGTWHSQTTNPVRQLQIDPSKGRVVSHTYAPRTRETWAGANLTVTGLTFI